MSRLVSTGSLVYDQLDFFSSPGIRISGIPLVNLSLVVFADNVLLPWTLADGSAVADSSISAGTVYFNEISGSPGYYAVRWFPDRIRFWRLIFLNATLSTEIIKEYDALAPGVLRPSTGGLNASFNPSC